MSLLRLPAPDSIRRARPLPRLLALVAAVSALSCSLPVASHGPYDPTAGLPGTPLPEGWPDARRPAWPHTQTHSAAPLWGLGPVQPPSASDCQGPQRVREVPGRDPAPYRGELSGRRDAAPAAVSKSVMPMAGAAADRMEPGDVFERRDSTGTASNAAPASSLALRRMAPETAPPAQAMQPQPPMPPHEVVSAGMVDDNAGFGEYLNFRQRTRQLGTRDRDVSERYRVEVRDAAGRPAADAEVALSWPGAARALRFARTDSAGLVWLHPRALLAPGELARLSQMEVQVRQGDDVARTVLQRGQKAAVQVTLAGSSAAPSRKPLDIVFLVDATGSMGDEIAKLRSSMQTIAARVGGLETRPDLCWGLVAYRDRGDAFLNRTHDLTNDLGAFQGHLARLQAGGGGDYPEALNEALHEAVHGIHWRGDGTARLVILIGDAPPHLDYGQPYYDQDSAAALARGIKIHSVGASGLDKTGEAVFRQIAQSTGGRFVFLTYAQAHRPGSGPGRETVHEVRDYSVDTLDELIVRLVRDELAPGAK